MRLDLTPWARRDIDPVVQEILRTMEPRKGTVHIGRALHDWRAVVTFNGWVISDLRGLTATHAAEATIEVLGRPEQQDGMTQAKARDDLRDGVAHFEWHGHDIEVEVS